MLPRNLLGAPLSRSDREAYCAALVEFFGSERAVGQYFVTAIDRVTNKSIGLLQADSIFAALALSWLPKFECESAATFGVIPKSFSRTIACCAASAMRSASGSTATCVSTKK